MQVLQYIVAGIVSGILGGMGMGGGTILIPILALIFRVDQHVAQSVNLLAFLPMALCSLIVHAKHHYVDVKIGVLLSVTGVIAALLLSYLVQGLDGNVLKKFFGSFLVLLSIWQIVATAKHWHNRKQHEKLLRFL